ncbi:UDP-N-acetylmuramoyl-tripeptide--D-alanyl-D-alanine ligase [Desulfocicer vacuolatum DSM 3385]|uniref:UDP-N-acetylmuramoyl-tripeptide--D-alanyl-D-alanine ligase n=1 Tax=Desulfocicer vacuolatum DSM 3385 TaxID=1121400 RepID=A0A1W1YHH2_9BACT|nr:UDP-N-acetylmuramoyl-tripeptide--D-alanyl-D-alanine ligase [Desulfocicer vacuolatum]SMC35572.1 UDP-N-acetylmuramoyl-tripeptide--D-alanyl-D-alanine ligase [Desulfocicer vacuolatum DSM 3385]
MISFSPIPWHTDHIIEALETAQTPLIAPCTFPKVATDSRTMATQDLFVAIKGETFDGHRFVKPLMDRGVRGFVVESSFFQKLSPAEKKKLISKGISFFCVENTLTALGKLAAFQRNRANVKVIGITGSCGKTSTREMITTIFKQKYKVLTTQGNFNNEIGLPLTLLNLSHDHQWAVVEMGMNHSGELTRLGKIARPDMGIITNTFRAHLEGLGSVEAVARAKSELLPCIRDKGLAILNRDDKRFHIMEEIVERLNIPHCVFGITKDARIRAQEICQKEDSLNFTLHCPGKKGSDSVEITLATPAPAMVENALAAATAALKAGFSLAEIKKGLADFTPVKGRMEILEPGCGIKLINDTYNANPGSMAAALDMISHHTGPTIAVLGDMLELGGKAPILHKEVGQRAAMSGISHLFIHGDMALHVMEGALEKGFPREKIFIGSHPELIKKIIQKLTPQMRILVKGSRGMRMEHIVTALHNHLGEKN